MKKEIDNKDYKIEILQQAINKFQSLFKLNNKFEFMQKLDISELKYKLYEIEKEMEKKSIPEDFSNFIKYKIFNKYR
jgi:DNA-binding protein H-NS